MNKVKHILKEKGHRVWKVSKDATVLEALQLMAEKGTASVVVMEANQITGIFTERDFARKVGLVERKPNQVKVDEVMSRDIITVGLDDTVNICMSLMTDKHIRHLPVVDKGELVGIVSIGDIVKDIISELESLVTQLENYITGFR
jgi:CBS domain-containing protein